MPQAGQIWREQQNTAVNQAKIDTAWQEQLRDVTAENQEQQSAIDAQVLSLRTDRQMSQIQHLQSCLDSGKAQMDRAQRAFKALMDRAAASLADALQAEQRRADEEVAALEAEFQGELDELRAGHEADMRLQSTIHALAQQAADDAERVQDREYRAALDDAANRTEELFNMRQNVLQARIQELESRFTAAHTRYNQATAGAVQQYRLLAVKDKQESRVIEEQQAQIEKLHQKVQLWRGRVAALQTDYGQRNTALQNERAASMRDYLGLREQHGKLEQDIQREAALLARESRSTLAKLRDDVKLAESIVRVHHLCQRNETQEELNWPFGRDEARTEAIVADAQYQPASELRRFYRRKNNAVMDLSCLQREYEQLQRENKALRGQVEAYLSSSTGF